MPLTKLHMVNFEEHQDTTLEFAPGITVIYGTTDQGKSSIRRAITWVACNRPVGPRSVRDNTKESEVTLSFDNSPSVTRGRKNDKNYYKIRDSKVDGTGVNIFKAFSTKVPDEVNAIVNLNEANIQEQFKKYYLLQDTPGQVAKTIHTLLGMDLVDTTATVVNRAIKQQAETITKAEITIAGIKKEIQKFAYLKAIEEEYRNLELAIQSCSKIEADIHNLTTTVEKCRILHKKILATQIPPSVEAEARNLQEELIAMEKKKDQIDKLSEGTSRLQEVDDEISKLEAWLTVERGARSIQKEAADIYSQEVRLHQLETTLAKIRTIDGNMSKVDQDRRANEKALEALKKKIKICPTCKKPF
ncbi:MAG: hypothetical protein EHM49_00435 [Deltaproteobacteria bacterium]|nr:MAG: hypothetical protein EHM49_00435 [Deltaproteobacteria bacterium]